MPTTTTGSGPSLSERNPRQDLTLWINRGPITTANDGIQFIPHKAVVTRWGVNKIRVLVTGRPYNFARGEFRSKYYNIEGCQYEQCPGWLMDLIKQAEQRS
jgi:hypothetical protein